MANLKTNTTIIEAASSQQSTLSNDFSRKLQARSKRLQKTKETPQGPTAAGRNRISYKRHPKRHRQSVNDALQETQEPSVRRRSQRISAKVQSNVSDANLETLASESGEDVDMMDSESSFFESDSASSSSEVEEDPFTNENEAAITTGKRKNQDDTQKEESVSLETTKVKRRRLRTLKITSPASNESLVIDGAPDESVATPVVLGEKRHSKTRRTRLKKSIANTEKIEKLVRHTKDELDLSSHSFLPEALPAETVDSEVLDIVLPDDDKPLSDTSYSHVVEPNVKETIRAEDTTHLSRSVEEAFVNAGQSDTSSETEQVNNSERRDISEVRHASSQAGGFWRTVFKFLGHSSDNDVDHEPAPGPDIDTDDINHFEGQEVRKTNDEENASATKSNPGRENGFNNNDAQDENVGDSQRSNTSWSLFSWVFGRSLNQNIDARQNDNEL
ncbi:hypothetical protein DFQ28_006068 [Apophysomyces sp. BC1034]|nr:hypothetical protein DFQ30_005731 [Apophysomyces sp. BC1015]KAG0177326.1 hypothetical protein DFQ29_004971 [Apophysomyces sp. BC1021]KAG0187624.1 hypothetical protein DFQ28_006068 [Apophysomyces sp. BC1034]